MELEPKCQASSPALVPGNRDLGQAARPLLASTSQCLGGVGCTGQALEGVVSFAGAQVMEMGVFEPGFMDKVDLAAGSFPSFGGQSVLLGGDTPWILKCMALLVGIPWAGWQMTDWTSLC